MKKATKLVPAEKKAKACHVHPDHSPELVRLKRIRGQLEGIERMISDKRYCVDILHQVKAARVAMRALETSILKAHLEACVKDALAAKNPYDAEMKIQEIAELMIR